MALKIISSERIEDGRYAHHCVDGIPGTGTPSLYCEIVTVATGERFRVMHDPLPDQAWMATFERRRITEAEWHLPTLRRRFPEDDPFGYQIRARLFTPDGREVVP